MPYKYKKEKHHNSHTAHNHHFFCCCYYYCCCFPFKLTSDEERQSFVIAHNKYRGIVSNPYAKSMPAVVWDSFLENEMQTYTDKCIWGHDSSRKYSVKHQNNFFFFYIKQFNHPFTHTFFFFLRTEAMLVKTCMRPVAAQQQRMRCPAGTQR